MPVAACTPSPPSPNMPIVQIATNQVATEAATATPLPIATGRR